MDDVTNGFNIGLNISLHRTFNEILGFIEAEVRGVLETYRDHVVLGHDVDEAMAVMREWYNGYRFAEGAPTICSIPTWSSTSSSNRSRTMGLRTT